MAIADPLPTPRKPPSAPSLIAENMTIEGVIKAEGELHIDGAVKGEVRVSRLTIGDAGQIEGTVTADTVEVRGKVVGAITAKQIRLAASAHVDGDITHEQLAIEAGAFFQGRSLKFQRQPAAAAAPAKADKSPSMKDLAREVAKADGDLRPEHVS
jgi:cytoskeletal protein CcmA (bactofilin family)